MGVRAGVSKRERERDGERERERERRWGKASRCGMTIHNSISYYIIH